MLRQPVAHLRDRLGDQDRAEHGEAEAAAEVTHGLRKACDGAIRRARGAVERVGADGAEHATAASSASPTTMHSQVPPLPQPHTLACCRPRTAAAMPELTSSAPRMSMREGLRSSIGFEIAIRTSAMIATGTL